VRFDREARATERLRSEHVRRVLGAGVTDGGARYIVMEYLEGEDLRALVKREGPLDARRAADYVSQACRALAEAHALGIVHRDLKPGNLFLARGGDGAAVVKVVDFGVAKFASPNVAGDARDVTAVGLVLGSRHYMAPEQILSPRAVDALADVWALGAILYHLLSGRTPFAAPTLEEVTLNVLCGAPHPLLELRPELPPQLVAVVSRCLDRDRARRFPNVVELLRALSPFARAASEGDAPRSVRGYLMRTADLGPLRLPAPPAPTSREAPPAPAAAKRAAAGKPARRARSLRVLSIATGAAFCAGGLLAAALLSSQARSSATGPLPAPASPVAKMVTLREIVPVTAPAAAIASFEAAEPTPIAAGPPPRRRAPTPTPAPTTELEPAPPPSVASAAPAPRAAQRLFDAEE